MAMRAILAMGAMLLGGTDIGWAAASQEPAADWVELSRHQSGPLFLDRGSIRREGNIVTVRSRTTLDEVQPDGTKTFVVRFRYDCSARTADLIAFTALDGNGRVLLDEQVPVDERQVETIVPDSPNATIADQVCR